MVGGANSRNNHRCHPSLFRKRWEREQKIAGAARASHPTGRRLGYCYLFCRRIRWRHLMLRTCARMYTAGNLQQRHSTMFSFLFIISERDVRALTYGRKPLLPASTTSFPPSPETTSTERCGWSGWFVTFRRLLHSSSSSTSPPFSSSGEIEEESSSGRGKSLSLL